MAGKITFISLGPAALEILRLDRKLKAQERANTPEAKEKRKRQALIREGSYFYDEDYDTEYIEDKEYRARKEQERAALVYSMYEKTLLYLADYTPVDTGNLFDSMYSECTDTYFIIGFDVHKAPYAVYQHENTALHHVNGRPQFLLQSVLEASMVADKKHKLSVNIIIKGLHEGAQLEVQVGKYDRGNLDLTLGKAGQTQSFLDEANTEFNHDFWSDIDATYEMTKLFEERADLLDSSALSEYMSNRRMFSATLGKLSEADIQDLLQRNMAANDATGATASLAALLMKRRINHRKAMSKLRLANTMGWDREES